MTATIISLMNKLYDAESTNGWTLNKGDVYSGFQREGNYCIGDQVSNTTYHFYKTLASSVNLQGKLVTFWVMLWGNPDTLANGGIRFVVGDGTNRVAIYVGGSDKRGLRFGGWECFALYMDATYIQNNLTVEQLAGSAFPDLTNVTEVGPGFKMTTKVVGTAPNVLWDVCYYGDGLKIVGGTASDPGVFKDIADADASTSNAWGIISETESGVFEIQGNLIFGDEGGSYDTYFNDKNVTLFYKDMWVPSNYYKWEIRGNTSTTTSFKLGEKSGSSGINGVVIRSPSSKNLIIDAHTYSSSIDEFGLYGCSIISAGTIDLPDSSAAEVLNTSFVSCGIVKGYSATFKNNNFITAPNQAFKMELNHNITSSQFISNNVGVLIETPGTFTFDALKFSGNTYDIENNSGGYVEIQCTNGANPTTVLNQGSSTTTIINTVYVTVKVVDSSLNPIQGARVYVYNTTDDQEIMNQLTNENGVAETTVNYQGDKDLLIRVRKSTVGNTRYIPVTTYGTLTVDGFDTTIVLYEDTVAEGS